jgi:ABC-2 type transport system permease protein
MNATLALIRTELTLLRRDTTAWTTAVAIPFILGAIWALNDPPFGEGLSAVIVLQVVMLLVFTLHTVGTMTLSSRREQLLLKRWRTSQASATSVVAGIIGVLAALLVLQGVALTAITAAISGQAPASALVLAVGVLVGVAMVGALTFVVAAFTRSAEHAMITTFPVIVLLTGGSVWTLMRPFDALDWPVLALPGGAVTQLLRLGWDGPAGAAGGASAWLLQAAPSIAATALLTVLATAAAVRCFRWEPRA